VAVAERLAESVTVTEHDPAATEVTPNVALGPLPDAGEIVAIPLQVLDCVSVPV
jgi:hypothetical protein